MLSRPGRELFPYPTLFRSAGPAPVGPGRAPPAAPPRRGRVVPRPAGERGLAERLGAVVTGAVAAAAHAAGVPGDAPGRGPTGGDRKSTRLNSSHLGISYAVSTGSRTLSLPDALPICRPGSSGARSSSTRCAAATRPSGAASGWRTRTG